MTTEQITTIAVGVVQSGAIGTFVWFLLRGLHREISSLNRTVTIQSDTISAMEKRVGEAEKIGELYKNLVREMPTLLESLSKGKDQIIRDLEATIAHREKKPTSRHTPNTRRQNYIVGYAFCIVSRE